MRTARAHAPLFLSKENARFVTLGWKEKEGQVTDQLSIKVYVGEKLLSSDLDDYNLLPNEVKAIAVGGKPLQGTIPIDVVSIGKVKFTLLGVRGGENFYIDSVGINGTCAILDNNGFIYTNAHVAADHNRDHVNDPINPSVNAIYDYTIYPGRINKISKLQPTGNWMDAAVIDISGFNPNDAWIISSVGSISGPVVSLSDGGIFEYFSGSEHVMLSMPEQTPHPIDFQLDNSRNRYGFDGFYYLQIEANSPDWPHPGHSGSMLLKNVGGKWHPAGLVFGLAESVSRAFVCVYSWNDVIAWISRADRA